MTHRMSHGSSYKHRKRPRSSPPPTGPHVAGGQLPLLYSTAPPLTHVASEGRWPGEYVSGYVIIFCSSTDVRGQDTTTCGPVSAVRDTRVPG